MYAAEAAELVAEKSEETTVEVLGIGAEPCWVARGTAQGVEHDSGVFASKVVCSLSKVDGDEAGALPKLVQRLGETVRDTNVIKSGWLTLGKTSEERRHGLDVTDLDVVGKQSALLELGVGHTNHLLIFSHGNVVLREIDVFTLVELSQKLHGARTVAHVAVVWVRGDANNSCSTQASKVVVLELLADQPGNEVATCTLAP